MDCHWQATVFAHVDRRSYFTVVAAFGPSGHLGNDESCITLRDPVLVVQLTKLELHLGRS